MLNSRSFSVNECFMALINMDIYTALLVACFLGLGCFVQSLVGFGMAIVAAPLLLVLDASLVPTTVTIIGLVLSSINTWQYRKSLSFKGLGWAYIGRVPGTVLAGVLMLYITVNTLEIFMGVAVLSAVVVSLGNFTVKADNKNMFLAGLLSGVMGTSTSIGGPPMALVLQNSETSALRANLGAYFIVSCILSLITLGMTGHFKLYHLFYALVSIPAVLFSSWAAYKLAHHFKPHWIRYALLLLCSVAGSSMLFKGLT